MKARLPLHTLLAATLAALLLPAAPARSAAPDGPPEARLLRFPDVRGDAVVFVYAGDIWRCAVSGGPAHRLTSHPGLELFPKLSQDDPKGGLETPLELPEGGSASFSPDGTKLAYCPVDREFRAWKRTKGGRAQDVWTYDFDLAEKRLGGGDPSLEKGVEILLETLSKQPGSKPQAPVPPRVVR